MSKFDEIASQNLMLAAFFAEVDQMHIIIGLQDRIKQMLTDSWDQGWWEGACES